MGKVEIFKGKDEQFYFRVVAPNNEILVVSEGYVTKQNCKNGIKSLMENIKSDIEDLT